MSPAHGRVGARATSISSYLLVPPPSEKIAGGFQQAGEVRLGLYDISGRLVATLADGRFTAGYHSVPISASSIGRRSPAGTPLPTGVYIIWLQAADDKLTRKIVMIR